MFWKYNLILTPKMHFMGGRANDLIVKLLSLTTHFKIVTEINISCIDKYIALNCC